MALMQLVVGVVRARVVIIGNAGVISTCRKRQGYRRGLRLICNIRFTCADNVILASGIVMVAVSASILIFAVTRRTTGRNQSTKAVLTRVCACVIVLIIVCVEIVQVSVVRVQVSTIASMA